MYVVGFIVSIFLLTGKKKLIVAVFEDNIVVTVYVTSFMVSIAVLKTELW